MRFFQKYDAFGEKHSTEGEYFLRSRGGAVGCSDKHIGKLRQYVWGQEFPNRDPWILELGSSSMEEQHADCAKTELSICSRV